MISNTICEAFSEFLPTLDMLSLTLMIGSFFLRSQTTQRAVNVEARICCTCRFQLTQATSSGGYNSQTMDECNNTLTLSINSYRDNSFALVPNISVVYTVVNRIDC